MADATRDVLIRVTTEQKKIELETPDIQGPQRAFEEMSQSAIDNIGDIAAAMQELEDELSDTKDELQNLEEEFDKLENAKKGTDDLARGFEQASVGALRLTRAVAIFARTADGDFKRLLTQLLQVQAAMDGIVGVSKLLQSAGGLLGGSLGATITALAGPVSIAGAAVLGGGFVASEQARASAARVSAAAASAGSQAERLSRFAETDFQNELLRIRALPLGERAEALQAERAALFELDPTTGVREAATRRRFQIEQQARLDRGAAGLTPSQRLSFVGGRRDPPGIRAEIARDRRDTSIETRRIENDLLAIAREQESVQRDQNEEKQKGLQIAEQQLRVTQQQLSAAESAVAKERQRLQGAGARFFDLDPFQQQRFRQLQGQDIQGLTDQQLRELSEFGIAPTGEEKARRARKAGFGGIRGFTGERLQTLEESALLLANTAKAQSDRLAVVAEEARRFEEQTKSATDSLIETIASLQRSINNLTERIVSQELRVKQTEEG